MKTLRAMLLAATAIGALAVGQAQAGPVTVTNEAIPNNEIVTLNNIDPAAPQSVYAGQMVLTTSMAQTIYAWCIDVFHDIGLGGNIYQFDQVPLAPPATDNATPIAHLLTVPQIGKLGGLFEIGAAILQQGELGLYDATWHNAAGATAADWSAAIQLAVWDAEYQPNYGSLNWSGGTAETRQLYDDLVIENVSGPGFELVALNGQQSFAGTDRVPEPAALALLAVGLIGFGFARYRGLGRCGAAIA